MIGNQTAPFRARALEVSGGNIKPDVQRTGTDGHPIGPGSSKAMAQKVDRSGLSLATPKPASQRPMPFAARAK
jgi:hypothetical protein